MHRRVLCFFRSNDGSSPVSLFVSVRQNPGVEEFMRIAWVTVDPGVVLGSSVPRD